MTEYQLISLPYSGIGPIELFEGGRAEVRRAAARRLRRLRNEDYPISVIAPGLAWEVETPDWAAMIGDREGIMEIREIAEPVTEVEEEEPWFTNYYQCPRCEHEWTDQGSATCDDDCPECGYRHVSPYESEDA